MRALSTAYELVAARRPRALGPLSALLLSALLMLSISRSVHYTRDYGGVDLRTRVVGARLLAAGESPYFYKWRPGDPDRWIITPHHPLHPAEVNGVSVSPGLLYLHVLFNPLGFGTVRWLWTLLQYVLLALCFGWLLPGRGPSDEARLRALGVGFLFFGCSALWLLNVERGQSYMLLAAGLAGLLRLAESPQRKGQYAAGVLLAVLVYLRPTMVVFGLPFLLAGRWRMLAAALAAGLPLALHMLLSPLWQDYTRSMAIYSGLLRSAPVVTPVWSFPQQVEGLDAQWIQRAHQDFRIGGLPSLFFKYQYWLRGLPPKAFLNVFAFGAATIVVLLRRRFRNGSASDLLLAGFLLYVWLEVLVPAPRGTYNMILWIVPSLVLLLEPRRRTFVWPLLLSGLCLVIGFPAASPLLHALGEVLLLLALLIHLWPEPVATAP
ncbi:glycosyltransferase 87 family protein [Flaviaesturariibacter terrae]